MLTLSLIVFLVLLAVLSMGIALGYVFGRAVEREKFMSDVLTLFPTQKDSKL